jgi:hypothetical protein
MLFPLQLIPHIIIAVIIAVFVARRMRKMGYSGLIWSVVGFLNPMLTVVLISSLPDHAVLRRREEELKLLVGQLRRAGIPLRPGGSAIPRRTISDDRTRWGEMGEIIDGLDITIKPLGPTPMSDVGTPRGGGASGREWYYETAAEGRRGPVSNADLTRLHREGVISKGDLIWSPGMATWVRFEETFLDLGAI